MLKMKIIYSICLVLTFMNLSSQNSIIKGFYDLETRSFETTDSTYWIDQFHNGIARISKDGYIGLIDTSGKIICPLKYDRIYNFYGSVARFGLNGKYGLLSKNGKELLPASLKKINDFNEDMAV